MLTLVTGATGLVGNNVVRLLLERGEAVRVLQRETSDPRPMSGLDVEITRGDVRDASSVMRAAEGVDRIIHSAAYVHIGWSGLDLHQSINVEGTRNVVAAALERQSRLVHVSTVDALGLGTRKSPGHEETPPDEAMKFPYVVTKRAAERAVLDGVAKSLDAVIVNPTYMLGPWDWKPSSGRMLLEVAKGTCYLAPRGGNDFCDVRDVAAGILAAAERGQCGRRYILGGESLSYLEAWRIFARVTGARGPFARGGPMAVIVAGMWGDMQHRLKGKEPDINSAATAMSGMHHHFTYARAAEELGYRPRSAKEAAEGAWAWFLENGYVKRKS
jgi:dihydroflavonol-4-reductase